MKDMRRLTALVIVTTSLAQFAHSSHKVDAYAERILQFHRDWTPSCDMLTWATSQITGAPISKVQDVLVPYFLFETELVALAYVIASFGWADRCKNELSKAVFIHRSSYLLANGFHYLSKTLDQERFTDLIPIANLVLYYSYSSWRMRVHNLGAGS